MLTRCPDCHTVYRVTSEQLEAAAGRVRCGQCGEVFDAQTEALAAPVRSRPSHAGPGAVPVPEAGHKPAGAPLPAAERTPAEKPPAADDAADVPPALWEDFEPRHARRHTGRWAAAAVLLSLTLAAQYIYYMRARLAVEHPQWRPMLGRMCSAIDPVLPCSMPLPREPGALRMLSSAVEEHPYRDGVLVVHATFVNTAPHAQRFPLLEVRLADLRGSPVALRRFGPEEYLEGGTDAAAGLAPQTPVTISLEVVQPQPDVSSFVFDFL